jgi:archaellum biogenesis ATPase FlaH
MLSEGVLALMIPIFAISIPIIVILTNHQRKMAELLHSNSNQNASSAESVQILRELSELRALVHQQSILIDNLSTVKSTSVENLPDCIQM